MMYCSFIVDNSPEYFKQGIILLKSLLTNAKIPSGNIVVNLTQDCPKALHLVFDKFGIQLNTIKPFGDGKYCNKVQQLEFFGKINEGTVLLFDTDIIVLNELKDLETDDYILGKTVDLNNPSIEILQTIFEAAGFDCFPDKVKVDLEPQFEMFVGNFNGGVYSIPTRYSQDLEAIWKKWIISLLHNNEILASVGKENHIDQISFCMAVHELNFPLMSIDRKFNCPTHLKMNEDIEPIILHYHGLDINCSIENVNSDLVNLSKGIKNANDLILTYLKDELLKTA